MSSAEAVRPARWPWLGVAYFAVAAPIYLLLVRSNGESGLGASANVVSMGTFAVVGALILSRDRGTSSAA